MDYDKREPPSENTDEAREPVAAYAVRGATTKRLRATKVPWRAVAARRSEDFEEFKGIDPEALMYYDETDDEEPFRESEARFDWLLANNPAFMTRLEHDVEKTKADIEAGRIIPHEAVVRHTRRFLETGVWDDDYGEEYKWVPTE
jgi:peptidoglycan/xylan/chitin deacetylase (PgdA/CDA1 family)